MLINWQVRLISLNFIIIVINLRWSDNIKFRRHEIFYTGFGEGGSPQRALIARFKPNWNIKGVSMPFSSTFLGQFSLFNLMKNINQLLSTNGIEVSMWYWVLRWYSASRWHESNWIFARIFSTWVKTIFDPWFFLSAVSYYSLFYF